MSKYQPVKVDFDTFKKFLLNNDGAKKEYDALSEEFVMIAEMIRARRQARKTQKEVAGLMKTTSSVVSRLESPEGQKKHSPTLATLRRYAQAVGCCLTIKFIPARKQTTR